MNISFLGAGYVGLVSAACLADCGHTVTCIDTDAAKIGALRRGQSPIYEPGLEALLVSNIAAGRLKFATAVSCEAVANAIIFIAVGTPFDSRTGRLDTGAIEAAVDSLAKYLDAGSRLIVKSTVPVGTCRRLEARLAALRPELGIEVLSNPEFLREGSAVQDFLYPDRIVAGVESAAARELILDVYTPMFDAPPPFLFTDPTTAEMIKWASNAYLATRVAFINELAELCEQVGADVKGVSEGMGLDRRIGQSFLAPGPGYGGSCLPKDTQALAALARENRSPMLIVEATARANEAHKAAIGRKIIDALGPDAGRKRVALLGLAFKAHTDDLRDAPALSIISALREAGVAVTAYDPGAMARARAMQLDREITLAPDALACVTGADLVAIVTEWPEFRLLNWRAIAGIMRGNAVIDLRNLLDGRDMTALGFAYRGLGRSSPVAFDTAPTVEFA